MRDHGFFLCPEFLLAIAKDSSGETGRLYDRLKKVFPARELFVDVDAIDP